MLVYGGLAAILLTTVLARDIVRSPDHNDDDETKDAKFVRSDGDANQELTFDEFLHTDKAYVELKRDEFNLLDGNKNFERGEIAEDGVVTRVEYDTFYATQNDAIIQQRAEYFGQLFEVLYNCLIINHSLQDFDENFDLKLDIDELTKMLRQRYLVKVRDGFARHFARFDVDKDGGLNLQETITFDGQIPFEEMDPVSITDSRHGDARRAPIHITTKTEKLPMGKSSVN